MTTQLGKRKIARREVPLIGTLIDKLPCTRLPTKGAVLRRIIFENETTHGSSSTTHAAAVALKDVKEVWEYAGYGDILQQDTHIMRSLNALRDSYRAITKIPLNRRSTDSYKKKEDTFLKSLDELFDISIKKQIHTGLITDEDRYFLLNHWQKPISSIRDVATKKMVDKP